MPESSCRNLQEVPHLHHPPAVNMLHIVAARATDLSSSDDFRNVAIRSFDGGAGTAPVMVCCTVVVWGRGGGVVRMKTGKGVAKRTLVHRLNEKRSTLLKERCNASFQFCIKENNTATG